MNNSLNEYLRFNFELNIELNHFLARFNVKMNNQNVSPTPSYRARKVVHVLGVVQRREYKSFSTYTAAAVAETQTKCFEISFPFLSQNFSCTCRCTSGQIGFQTFSATFLSLTGRVVVVVVVGQCSLFFIHKVPFKAKV
jgi:hypothetical protein